MADLLNSILTDKAARDVEVVEQSLIDVFDVAIAWFDKPEAVRA